MSRLHFAAAAVDSTIPSSFHHPTIGCSKEAEADAAAEPLLSSFLYASILSHDNFERSLAFVLSNRLSDATFLATELFEVFYSILRWVDKEVGRRWKQTCSAACVCRSLHPCGAATSCSRCRLVALLELGALPLFLLAGASQRSAKPRWPTCVLCGSGCVAGEASVAHRSWGIVSGLHLERASQHCLRPHRAVQCKLKVSCCRRWHTLCAGPRLHVV